MPHTAQSSTQTLCSDLRTYLRENRIAADAFSCIHRDACREAVERCGGSFTEASDTEVGDRYASASFKLVHVSIDPPAGWTEEHRRLADTGTEYLCKPYDETLPRARTGHWYWLLRVAGPILRAAGIATSDVEAHRYIVHTRAMRCSSNLPKGTSGPEALAHNCAEYLKGELSLLRPSMVLTMGRFPERSLERAFPDRPASSNAHLRSLTLNGLEVPWIAMPHPTAFGRFHKVRNERLQEFCNRASAAAGTDTH